MRDACFAAVGLFEIAFRNRMSEVLSDRGGSHPYYNAALFKNAQSQDTALKQVIGVSLNTRDDRAKHYRRTYDTPALPPIWMLKEFLTFGASAKFFKLLSNQVQQDIAAGFGITALPVFKNWVECFVDLRNITAHHDRLFNRRFQKQPSRLRSANVPTAPHNTLKALLECLDHSLVGGGQKGNVTVKAEKIILRHSAVTPAEAGF